MSDATPQKKVAAGGLAGAVSVVFVWVINSATAIDVPPEVASAFTTILSFAIAYMVPEHG